MLKCRSCKGLFDQLSYGKYCSARLCMEACINELERAVDKATYASHVAGQKESIRRFAEFLAGMSGTIVDATQKPDVVVNLQEEANSEEPDFQQIALNWIHNNAHPETDRIMKRMDVLPKLLSEQWNAGFNAGLAEDR